MLQILQYQKTGELFVEELPAPRLQEGGVLVQNVFSAISVGTEKSSVETAKASLIGKAKSRPDLVKQVLSNIKRDGIISTYQKVKTRLDNYKALGYSSAGVVIESGCDEFLIGDRVACAGAGYASHAEIIFVPKNLIAKIPENVDFDEAAFVALGAIAIQGVRQADVRIGENVAVIGLGLIGQLTTQILKAAGCNVIGFDISDLAIEIARELGADELAKSDILTAKSAVESFTQGRCVDAVIITASTKSNAPIDISGVISRDRGRVVIVGDVKTDIPRSQFYEKEIEIRMSRSYGPGRYDMFYEEKGYDYPIGYVRWTENRNMESFLKLISEKKVNIKKLITHRFSIVDAIKAYDLILGKTQAKYICILIEYPEKKLQELESRKSQMIEKEPQTKIEKLYIGCIGAGNFAQSYLLPLLKKNPHVNLKIVVDSSSIVAKRSANKFDFSFASTDANEILDSKDIDAIFISTRHDSHASLVLESLKRGKKVYVEKPLAIDENQLLEIDKIMKKSPNLFLMVGYNRRFSHAIKLIKNLFYEIDEPLILTYRINAGLLPKEHWIKDPSQGGRIIGEGCHFIDTMRFIASSNVKLVYANSLSLNKLNYKNRDNISVIIQFEDGSIGTLSYFETGDPSFSKEHLEVYGGQKAAILNDFQYLEISNLKKRKRYKLDGRKGHKEEIEETINSMLKDKGSPISYDCIFNTTKTTFSIIKSLETGLPQSLID